ncbi:hypothetical protein ABZ707_10235 [Streptomyces sp. NPDC006923]|uniref:hypothetical protein n=1 Tax=Streptomyces sp. NPDC006923 TaxID=3155355 RepID=UPI0034118F14
MSERHTYPSAPTALPLRLDAEPKPVPGCAHCHNIARKHDRAQVNGDASKHRAARTGRNWLSATPNRPAGA